MIKEQRSVLQGCLQFGGRLHVGEYRGRNVGNDEGFEKCRKADWPVVLRVKDLVHSEQEHKSHKSRNELPDITNVGRTASDAGVEVTHDGRAELRLLEGLRR